MVTTLFATKRHMTQGWTTSGRRVCVTTLSVGPNPVISEKISSNEATKRLEVGYGAKKISRMTKPLREKLKQSGFSFGVRHITGLKVAQSETELTKGSLITLASVLEVGDVVDVQGVTKGKGFAGVVKRHGFKGGPKTHGQSDRQRAPGSIGQRTTPGRVFKGKRMAGHMGVDVQTTKGLTVVHLDPTTQVLWLSGPIPGAMNAMVKITKVGRKKDLALDMKASGLPEMTASSNADQSAEVESPVVETEVEAAPVAEASPEVPKSGVTESSTVEVTEVAEATEATEVKA